MPRIRWHWLTLFIALPLLLLAGLAMLALQAQPLVPMRNDLTSEDVERVLQLARSHDPRRAIPGIVRPVRLTAHEADLLLNHAAERWRKSHWQTTLQPGKARLQASIEVDALGLVRWLNVELSAHETSTVPVLDSVRVGRLPLPVPLVLWWLDRSASALAALRVTRVQIRQDQLQMVYAWAPDAPARLLAALLPAEEQERLRVYAIELARITARLAANQPVSLSQLLPPLFDLARRRTVAGHAGALENRAALMVLGMVANGVGLGMLLPERAAELDPRPIRLTLAGRRDFPQHFLVSATLAAENGAPMADSIGLFKELADARSGSGFSFNDIAANRAGTRFGELAVQSPDKLQARLLAGLAEQDFMPDVADLPEFMQAAEFRRRFGGPGSPAYERMVADIEQRVTTTALFR